MEKPRRTLDHTVPTQPTHMTLEDAIYGEQLEMRARILEIQTRISIDDIDLEIRRRELELKLRLELGL